MAPDPVSKPHPPRRPLRSWTALVAHPGVHGLGLVILTVAAYASALRSGFVSDDLSCIVAGRLITSLRNLPQVFLHDTMWNSVGDAFARASAIDTYRPLPLATFFVERAVFGLNASGYHAGSVLLHALNVLLLWQLGRRLGLLAGAAFLAAAIFSVHPSISEAVHWINGRSDPMAVLFLLGALLVWLPGLRGERVTLLRIGGITVLVFCASLCKETTFVFAPCAVVLALSILRAERRRLERGAWLALATPWVAGLSLGFLVRSLVLGRLAAGSGSQVGYALVRVPLVWRDGLFSLLVPSATIRAGLFSRYRDVDFLAVLPAVALVLGLLAAAAWAYRSRKLVLLPWFVSVFLLTLAPVALLTSTESWAGWGRYLYPSTPALALAVAELGHAVLAGRWLARWRPALAVCLILLLGIQTFAAGSDYRSERSLNLAQIRDDPECSVGYLQLGSLERHLGRTDRAIPFLEQGVRLDPRSTVGWSLLAWSYLATGRPGPAYQAARTARHLDATDKVARFVESAVLLQQGRQDEAAAVLLPLLGDDPGSPGLWQEMDKALRRFGPASPFSVAVRKATTDDRYRHIQARLQATLAARTEGVSWLDAAP